VSACVSVFIGSGDARLAGTIQAILAKQPEHRVAAVSDDGREVLDRVTALRPDIVILSPFMPGVSGFQICQWLGRTIPAARVLIISEFAHEAWLQTAARDAGAAGLLDGDKLAASLLLATEAVIQQKTPEGTAEGGIPGFLAFAPRSRACVRLSRREREEAVPAGQGHTNPEIAGRLGISPTTVKTYVSRTEEKLGVRSRREIQAMFLRGELR